MIYSTVYKPLIKRTDINLAVTGLFMNSNLSSKERCVAVIAYRKVTVSAVKTVGSPLTEINIAVHGAAFRIGKNRVSNPVNKLTVYSSGV